MTQAMHQILVIEDEPAIRGVLRVLLEAEGGARKLTILATGSELHLAVEARAEGGPAQRPGPRTLG